MENEETYLQGRGETPPNRGDSNPDTRAEELGGYDCWELHHDIGEVEHGRDPVELGPSWVSVQDIFREPLESCVACNSRLKHTRHMIGKARLTQVRPVQIRKQVERASKRHDYHVQLAH
jgi:hypothetical protein